LNAEYRKHVRLDSTSKEQTEQTSQMQIPYRAQFKKASSLISGSRKHGGVRGNNVWSKLFQC